MATNRFIEHNGVRYYRDKQGWRASAGKGHRRLHAVLWEERHGPVPQGFHLFCSDQERPSLDNIELRPAYAGMNDTRQKRHGEAEAKWFGLLADVKEGMTREEIAQAKRVSHGTAQRWCRRFAIPKAKCGPKPKYDERIRELHHRGLKQVEIAASIGIAQQTVSMRIAVMGLPPRRTNLQPSNRRP